MAGHISFAAILLAFSLRDSLPLPVFLTIGILSLLFGTVQGAHGIAASSEMLALIPAENKSLSTGLNMTLLSAGISCSGLLSGQIIKLQILQPQWILFGNTLSNYDTLLLGSGIMLILLTVTLGLVPSVMGIRSQWVPQNQ